jgi:AcrR family transcriptional regulator
MTALPAATITPRSAATRAKLVRIAEQLFAEHGVGAVSLNEISKAAEQRHSNVCQYHFGDKDGLIQAVIDKHVPDIAAMRGAMFEAMDAAGRDTLEDAIHVFVRPVIAKYRDPDGGVAFIRFSAQMIAPNVLLPLGLGPYRFKVPDVDVLSRRLLHAMRGQALPEPVVSQRLTMAAIMLFQGLATYSQISDAGARADADLDRFAGEIEAMIIGALTAPHSEP